MKLSKQKRETLDARYTAYNPDQEVDGPDSLVDLVCPIHGPYKCLSEHLLNRHARWTLRPPRCAGCKAEKQTDSEYLMKVKMLWSIYKDDNPHMYDPEDYPIHPEFSFMDHWVAPNV